MRGSRGVAAVTAVMFAALGLPRGAAGGPASAPVASASSATFSASAAPSAPADEKTTKAREEFLAGAKLVENAEWVRALAAFERSAALRPHSVTTYNIGACERALGRYTRARKVLLAALDQNEAAGGKELPSSYADEARGMIETIDKLLLRVDVTLSPSDAAIAIDGRPLASEGKKDGVSVLIAGIEPMGSGTSPSATHFVLVVDPGSHLVTVSRKGFQDIALTQSFGPTTRDLKLDMERLPAKLRIKADRDGAVVLVNGMDVGVAPIELSRPGGVYEIQVKKLGYVTYHTQVDVKPGEQSDQVATLTPETTPLTKKWWFWTAAGVLVTGAAVTTYLLTRPAPQHPAPNGGGLGWVVTVP
jgi:hypothetical protein